MAPHQNRLCPLTKRLAEDMKIRNLAQATIDAYTYHARRFADFSQKSRWTARPRKTLDASSFI